MHRPPTFHAVAHARPTRRPFTLRHALTVRVAHGLKLLCLPLLRP